MSPSDLAVDGVRTDERRREGRVAAAVEHYHALLLGEHREETTANLARHAARHEPDAGGAAKPRILRPHLMTGADYERIAGDAVLVARGLAAAADLLVARPPLRRLLGLPEYLEPLLAVDASHGSVSGFARLDGLVRRDGSVAFIEYNSEPKGLQRVAERLLAFDRLPLTAAFRRRHPFRTVPLFEAVTDALFEASERRRIVGPPRVAVLGAILPQEASQRWAWYAGGRGCHVLFAGLEACEFRGGALRVADTPVDMVVFHTWGDLLADSTASRQVLAAVAADAVHVFHGLSRGLLCSYKHTFELLSNPEYESMFPPDVAAAVSRRIPWTRVLFDRMTTYHDATVDLLPFVEAQRERFLLKPSGGSGGRGIVCGWETSRDEWAAAVNKGIGRHVVQERVVPERMEFPVLTSAGTVAFADAKIGLDPYVRNGNRAAGCATRLFRTDVNGASDREGTIAPLWILDGE